MAIPQSNTTKSYKLPDHLKDRVLSASITKLEASLLRELRSLEYGEIRILIVKFDGQPTRIEVESIKKSKNLEARDGLDLDDTVYIDKQMEAEDLRFASLHNKFNKP